MHTATPPPPDVRSDRPDRPDRSGAVWVTATGALLLLAAAATFVAVRWDQLHDWQKFAALVLVTQSLLVGGWIGRRRVPATAAATFSLGAVLVPLDAWTIAASGSGDWHRGLFVGGALGVVALPIARRLFDTVALRWAWTVCVPVAAAGTAAFVGGPPPAVAVAALGLIALSAGRRTDGLAWLGLAAITPVATLGEPGLPIGRGVLHDLGLLGGAVPWATAVTAVLLIAAAAINGKRLARPDLVVMAVVLAVVDTVAALALGQVATIGWCATAAATLLAVEVLATATSDDEFWSRQFRPLVQAAEWASAFAWLVLANMLLEPQYRATVAAATVPLTASVMGLAWVLSDHRNGRARGRTGWRSLLTGDGSIGTCLAVTAFLTLAVGSLPVGPMWIGLGWSLLGTALLLGRRAGGAVTGTFLVGIAGPLALAEWSAGFVVAAASLLVLSLGARAQRDEAAAIGITVVGSTALVIDAMLFGALDRPDVSGPALLLGTIVGALAIGSISARRDRPSVAIVPWLLALLTTALILAWEGHPVIAVVGPTMALAWFLGEVLLRRHRLPMLMAALTAPTVSTAALLRCGLEAPQLGVGLAVVAIAVVGVTLATGHVRHPALLGTAALHVIGGAAFASNAPGTLGVVVTIAGALLVAVSVVSGSVVPAYNGGGLALLGIWQTLFGYRVGAAEAYLAPLALVLLLAGMHARATRTVSSWIAYAPPIAVLGGGALALRLAGDPGWHGVVAGAVAVTAVAAGSWLRLAGPLFAGSALLAAITVNETLSRSAGVPTWIWLASGGTVLLGAGVTMELRGLGPIESGRRVVELVTERFE